MNDRELLKKLKQLKTIKPEKKWLVSKRQELINHIAEEETEFKTLDSFFGWFWYHRLQPSLLLACMFLIVGAGPLLTVKAAQSSLPGDLLYTVKKVTENVQIYIASEDNKAQIQIDFASKRIEELEKITADSYTKEGKTVRTKEIINDLKSSMSKASASVESASKEQVVIIAKKTKKIEEDLKKVREETEENVNEVMAEAKEAVEDTSARIMAILIEVEDVASTTEDIIEDIKDNIEEVVDVEFIVDNKEETENTVHETTTEDILE